MSTMFQVRVTEKPAPREICFELRQHHPDASIYFMDAQKLGLRVLFASTPWDSPQARLFYGEDDPVFEWLDSEAWLNENASRFIEGGELKLARPLKSDSDYRRLLTDEQGLEEGSDEYWQAIDRLDAWLQEHGGLAVLRISVTDAELIAHLDAGSEFHMG